MRSPLFSILFGLYFQFIGDSLTLKLPIVFTDCADDNLFVLIYCCIGAHIFSIIHLLLFSHLNLIHHLISFFNLLISVLGFLLLQLFDFFIFWFFETEVFPFQCFPCQLIQYGYNLFTTTGFKF